ncbi:MAG: hypothetical protein ACI9H8_000308 [Lysobacterales bacterium]
MNYKTIFCILTFLSLLANQTAIANNVTISSTFDGGGPEMGASPASCGEFGTQVYQEIGVVHVSATGIFEIADAGNLLGFTGEGRGIVDIVISIYQDDFNPGSPSANRLTSIDEGVSITLEADKDYVLVIQPWCENISGVFAIILRGDATFTGQGFESDSVTFGQHDQTDPTASFPEGIGTHSYNASGLISVFETGLYYFGDVGINFNAGITLLAYENAFDPASTGANLAGIVSNAGSLLLSKDKSYVFVAVDTFDLGGNWQYTLFPPGPARFNDSMRGAWVTPGVDGAGVLMEAGLQSNILFFAWFTFPDAPALANSSKTAETLNSKSQIGKEADIGSTDQRWLTGFGVIHPDNAVVDISYENTTGGQFNATLPKPTTDSIYGFGTAQVFDCNNIIITFDLPGGVSGSAAMMRAIPDGMDQCEQMRNAAPIIQAPQL